MAGPTNTQLGLAPIDMDTEKAVRKMCDAQGCTCGERLKVFARPATEDEKAKLPPGAKHSVVDLVHRDSCPLLAATRSN